MELRERLEQMLKSKFGIENEADLVKAVNEMPGIDLGIFTAAVREETQSA